MRIGKRAALGGAILAFAAMPASTAMGAEKKAKITVKSVAAVPFSAAQGGGAAQHQTRSIGRKQSEYQGSHLRRWRGSNPTEEARGGRLAAPLL